jgi:hypothetical protein
VTLQPESSAGAQPGDKDRLIAAVREAATASDRSSRALTDLTRALVWLTFVVASAAVVSLVVALIQ